MSFTVRLYKIKYSSNIPQTQFCQSLQCNIISHDTFLPINNPALMNKKKLLTNTNRKIAEVLLELSLQQATLTDLKSSGRMYKVSQLYSSEGKQYHLLKLTATTPFLSTPSIRMILLNEPQNLQMRLRGSILQVSHLMKHPRYFTCEHWPVQRFEG